jgi:glutamate-1-semialdehyde 2,1-aminomutase
MDHCPSDWHDLAGHHDFSSDQELRMKLIKCGIYFFPSATKQCSISFAHTKEDIEVTLEQIQGQLMGMLK